MDLLATFVLSQIMAVTLCSAPAAITLPDENALQQEIGKIVGKVIQDLRGKDAPKVVGRGPIKAAQNAAGRSEQDIQKFNERLQAYGGASAAWIVKLCELTDEQQLKLREILDGQLVQATSRFAKSKDANGEDQGLPMTMPLLFTLPFGPGTDFAKQIIAAIRKDLLTEEQTQRLETALGERTAFRSQAYLAYIVSIVDEELFLIARQRKALLRELRNRETTLQHPLYAFTISPQSHYVPYASVLTILKASEWQSFLAPSQQTRLQDLSHNQPNRLHLIIGSASEPEELTRQIASAGQQQRDVFLRAAAVRISYYEKELQLSAEQADHLRIASKGAAAVALADWKETVDQTKQDLAQMVGNVLVAVALMDTNSLDRNEIWADAVFAVTQGMPRESLNQRQESNRTATAEALLAIYDSELWLTPDQREPLGKLILQTLPSGAHQSASHTHFRDLILMTYPLFKTTENQRAEVISESQQNVWKQLESSFRWQQQNNQVEIPVRNGGSFRYTLTE